MFNLVPSSSRLSRSSSQKTSSTSSSSSSRLSVLPNFRRSNKPDLKHHAFNSSQTTLSSSSAFAEEMDDDNIAWGPASRKKRHT